MDLLIILVIAYVLQNTWIDAKYAARGQTSPRWEAKLERLRQAGKPAVKPRYGSKDYFADLWSDALEAKTARRRARATERDAKAKAAELDAAVGEALTVAAPAAEPTQPTTGVIPVIVEPAPAPKPPASAPEPTGPDAQVIPMFRTPQKEEVAEMSVAEVTGLQSAIAHAEAVAAAHEQHSMAGGEGYLSSLAGFGVRGQAIQLVATAQEFTEMAAGAWRAAATELAKQNMVKEAYDAVPDAGSREFVQGE